MITDPIIPHYEASQFLAAGFSVTIPCQINLGNGLKVECVESLRVLPKKRHVFKAITKEGSVIVKLIGGKKRARKQNKSEAAGLNLLNKLGVPAPKVKQVEVREADDFGFIVLEYLESARSFLDIWQDDLSSDGRKTLLQELMQLMADLHNKGVMQSDIHLDNFMIKDSVIYVIDGATLTTVNGSIKGLATQKSFDNLAVLFAQFYTRYDDLFPCAYEQYLKGRDELDDEPWSVVEKLFMGARKHRLDKYQKKIFRSSTAHFCHDDDKLFILCDRNFYSQNMRLLLEDLDQYIEQSEKLKEGNSATVVRLTIDGKDLVIKRYNMKSSWHWVKRQIGASRAATSWVAAHLFSMIGVLTPRPIAMVQKKSTLFKREAYYISEVVPAEFASCDELITKGLSFSVGEKLFSQVFTDLRRACMSHGDLKATNFFVSGDQVMVIDLDAVTRHSSPSTTNSALLKDQERFARNW